MATAKSSKSIIQVQLKLKLRPAQERILNRWLWHLTGVYNWAIRKIELDARDNRYHSRYDIDALLVRHSATLGLPARVIEGTARTAHNAWNRCFKKLAGRPKLKGQRNKLNTIPFREAIARPVDSRIWLSGFGKVRFHSQDIPAGKIKGARLIRRSSGWIFCLFVEAEPAHVPHIADGEIGIDPGFSSLLSVSDGSKVEHPRELQRTSGRLAQAQRGRDSRLTARLQERQACQRRDRNHKLSRRLVSENALIAWSKDSHKAIAKRFGKSVASAAHGELRLMLSYKCRTGGRQFVEVPGRYSTVTCSTCGARSGPTGYAGLSVRHWACGCGASHDRDTNAAINTLNAARGLRVERVGDHSSGIAL